MRRYGRVLFTSFLSLVFAGCAMRTGSRHHGPTNIDACPAGGTLTVTLWDVYATPRKPDGTVWDGVESGTIELLCSAAASASVQPQGTT